MRRDSSFRTVRDGILGTHNMRYGLSYRDLEELLAERGIEVDDVTLFIRLPWITRHAHRH